MENDTNDSQPDKAAGKALNEKLMLKAMGDIIRVLEPLTPASRRRVLRAAAAFYELAIKEDDAT